MKLRVNLQKIWTIFFLFLSVTLLAGCSAGTRHVRINPDTINKVGEVVMPPDGTYIGYADSGDYCTGPVRTYDYEYTVKGGEYVPYNVNGEKRNFHFIGKRATVGVCQELVVGIGKSLVPSAVTLAVGLDRNDAMRKVGNDEANARIKAASISSAAVKYAVDNEKGTVFMEDNRIFTNTDVGVDVEVGTPTWCVTEGCE